MKRFAILAAGLLLAHGASAAPNWQVTSFSVEPQNLAKVMAATDALLSSSVGKTLPGTVSLMVNLIDGNDPSTHSFITAFDSIAEREAFFQKLQADDAWGQFMDVFTPVTNPGGTSRMTFLKSWGEDSDKDVVWQIHAFTVTDDAAFADALDAFLASDAGKDFPGQVHLSAVSAAGMTDVTHLISVGFESEAEAETWGDGVNTTSDWAAYLDVSGKASDFGGTYLIRSLKTWGAPKAE
jgi:hypothetical protein